jgi:glycosyltransferase involved in cell wall biosynthesis
LQSFEQVLNDDRITEIVIVDDHSAIEIYEALKEELSKYEKVRLYRNEKNLGMSLNKFKSVELCTNEWVIIFDSDNVIDSTYVDAIAKKKTMFVNTIYCPSFAAPSFDYRQHEGKVISKMNIGQEIQDKMLNCCMNTCNYVVHRRMYLDVYQMNKDMKGTDTLWFAYLWLKSGKNFFIVPDMHYMHRVHDGSGFMEDLTYNMKKADELKSTIINMSHGHNEALRAMR